MWLSSGFAKHAERPDAEFINWLHDSKGGYGWETPSTDATAKPQIRKGQHKAFRYDSTTDHKPLTHYYSQAYSIKAKAGKDRDLKAPDGDLDPQGNGPIKVWSTVKTKTSDAYYPNVLLGHVLTPSVLGVNLFNNQLIQPTSTPESTKCLEDLAMSNHPWWDEKRNLTRMGAPGLYVWGVNETGLGDTKFAIYDQGTLTPTNKGSIMLLLVWLKGTDHAVTLDNLHISLYTGADAEYKAEQPLVAWLQKKPNDYLNTPGKIIEVIKAGHHGSSAGSSLALIQNAKPDHYIISNGRDHWHPRPEVRFSIVLAQNLHTRYPSHRACQKLTDTAGTGVHACMVQCECMLKFSRDQTHSHSRLALLAGQTIQRRERRQSGMQMVESE